MTYLRASFPKDCQAPASMLPFYNRFKKLIAIQLQRQTSTLNIPKQLSCILIIKRAVFQKNIDFYQTILSTEDSETNYPSKGKQLSVELLANCCF